MIFFPLKIDICVFAVDETFSKKNYEPIWSCTLLNTEVCTRCHKCRCEWTGSIKMLMSVHYASLYSFSLSILSLLFHCLSFVSKLFSLFFYHQLLFVCERRIDSHINMDSTDQIQSMIFPWPTFKRLQCHVRGNRLMGKTKLRFVVAEPAQILQRQDQFGSSKCGCFDMDLFWRR